MALRAHFRGLMQAHASRIPCRCLTGAAISLAQKSCSATIITVPSAIRGQDFGTTLRRTVKVENREIG
ncbi:MAG: hypothetical protein WDN69_22165, partial [Aliidongia sp.]